MLFRLENLNMYLHCEKIHKDKKRSNKKERKATNWLKSKQAEFLQRKQIRRVGIQANYLVQSQI